MIRQVLIFLTVGLLLGGSFASAAEQTADKLAALPDGTLSATELRSLFSGRTVEAVTAAHGRESSSYYDPNGEVRQQRLGQTRRGHWRVTEDHRICLQMEDLPEKCRIVVHEQGEYRKYILKKNGRHQHTVTYRLFHPGNRLGL